MKKVFLLGLVTVVSLQSHALVADRFKCVLEINDLDSQASTKQEQEFFIGRLPLSASPAPDVRITAGQTMLSVTLNTTRAELGANLNFYYKHATKIDSNGVPTEARQLTCIGLSGSYCPAEDLGLCTRGIVACMEPKDPFDLNNGWSPSTLIGGVPAYNEHGLTPVTATIKDDQGQDTGTINLNCQYLGSFQ
ncbi:MAG: hypothetical protein A2Z20_00765 [Bdellovibrionales bacterium RBG_16_40_8]|nr:MAG: hypothetical protein A2Z20_00765 [Bdellovibrionales bacterium RBG_16_40_8]